MAIEVRQPPIQVFVLISCLGLLLALICWLNAAVLKLDYSRLEHGERVEATIISQTGNEVQYSYILGGAEHVDSEEVSKRTHFDPGETVQALVSPTNRNLSTLDLQRLLARSRGLFWAGVGAIGLSSLFGFGAIKTKRNALSPG